MRVRRVVTRMAEKKVIENSIASAFVSVGTTPVEGTIANIAQGTNSYSRVGRKIAIQGIRLHGTVVSGAVGAAATDDAYNRFRIMLSCCTPDTSTSSGPMASHGVTTESSFTRAVGGGGGNQTLLRKLLDRKLILRGITDADGSGYQPIPVKFDYNIRLRKPIVVTWLTDAVTYPDKVLWVSMVSDSAIIPHPGVLSGCYCNVYFTDI